MLQHTPPVTAPTTARATMLGQTSLKNTERFRPKCDDVAFNLLHGLNLEGVVESWLARSDTAAPSSILVGTG